ncbi:MAG: homocysteine S-methyltransferase family protein [Treponema sp.]|nr:homocysteine S-methyltransferase family protein [Treponema sp.]
MKNKLEKLLGTMPLFFDGGTGTILQSKGLKPGELPETWNLKHADIITQLHYDYFMAGANIIKTNSFGAFETKFALNLKRIIEAALENANLARKKAAKDGGLDKLFIAFDISSTGKLLKPMGDLDFEDCITLYKKTFRIAFKAAQEKARSFDCILIETMNDGYETKAAIIAAKETMEKCGVTYPILVTNVYDAECRTLSGSTPETMTAMLEGLGVSALGVNCSLGPKEMLPAVERLCAAASVPVIINPNAGLPKVVDGKTIFDVDVKSFVQSMKKIAAIPSRAPKILGGCCGTTPQYIKATKQAVEKINGKNILPADTTCVISSNTKTVCFGKDYSGKRVPCVLIGERINPTGKKKFKEALRNNDIDYIIHQGLEQEEAGAQVLDVNVGLPEIDEKEMMVRVMTELQAVTDLPLQIDTSSAKVMEAALRRYNGKPLVNSVNGKKEIMDSVFPLVKKYGGVVIGLTLDEKGISAKSSDRLKIAQKIYKEAARYGIAKKNIIIDPLAMAVSSDSQAGLATLETVRGIFEAGGNTSLGISNVSFGLPNREFVTSAFFTMAMQNGLSAAIMNPLQLEMKKAWYTTSLLLGLDENCANYIEWINNVGERLPLGSALQASPTPSNGGSTPVTPPVASDGGPSRASGTTVTTSGTTATGSGATVAGSNGVPEALEGQKNSLLKTSIIKGLKNDAAAATRELLKTTESLEIINNHLIPGLDYVGKQFEAKKMYLPQLLMAADAAKTAFDEIRGFMEKSGKKGKSKGKVIIATVKGDIHDIGKNIVKVLLQNYDFDVIDLGKDVPPETVVAACKKDKVMLVGLSALMTTTVAAMEDTIKLLRKECPWAKVCVGGAVMTQEYADKIGADFYGKDAMDTVRYALELFK